MLQTPWIKTYDALGIQTTAPSDKTLADYIEGHASARPDSIKVYTYNEAMAGMSAAFETVKTDPDDTFMIQYTGGTTGKPKGAMLSHRTLMHNPVQVLALAPDVQVGNETYVTAFPLFHIAGLCFCMMAILTGGSYECLPDPRDTNRICDVLKARAVTRFAAVPALYDMLVANPKFAEADFSRISMACSGAAPMTKTTSEIGEICSAGPQLMKGYLGLPEESARAMREIDGERWMFTGDVGYMDEDGYVFLCDRAKDMLVVGGFKVFSVEVEDKLAALPMVAKIDKKKLRAEALAASA